MPMPVPETSSEGPAIAVPNFREDERVQARYASMLERRIKDQFFEQELRLRSFAERRCSDKDDAAAQEAYRHYQELTKQPRSFLTYAPFDETEGQVIELLAKLAEEKTG